MPGLNGITQPLNPGQNDLDSPTPYMQSINLPENQSQPQYPYEIKHLENHPLPIPQSQQTITIQPGIQYNKPTPITNIQNENNNNYHQVNNLINDNSNATKSRLKCQIAMIILLFITFPISLALQIIENLFLLYQLLMIY